MVQHYKGPHNTWIHTATHATPEDTNAKFVRITKRKFAATGDFTTTSVFESFTKSSCSVILSLPLRQYWIMLKLLKYLKTKLRSALNSS